MDTKNLSRAEVTTVFESMSDEKSLPGTVAALATSMAARELTDKDTVPVNEVTPVVYITATLIQCHKLGYTDADIATLFSNAAKFYDSVVG